MMKFIDETGEGGIEDLAVTGLQFEVGDVGIPTIEFDFDAANAGFDESYGGEAASTEGGIAELLDGILGFLGDIEGCDLSAFHHFDSALGGGFVEGFVAIHFAQAAAGELAFDDIFETMETRLLAVGWEVALEIR